MRVRDTWLFALAVIPIGALLLLFATSFTVRQFNQTALISELSIRFGEEAATAPAPMKVSFPATSTKQSAALAESIRWGDALYEKYAYLLQMIDNREAVAPEDRATYDQVLAQFASDIQPWLKSFDRIDFNVEPIWMPVEHGHPNVWAGSVSQFRMVWHLLRMDVRAAVSIGEQDRAIDSLARLQSIAAVPLAPRTMVSEMVRVTGCGSLYGAVLDVIAETNWTSEQLERMDALLEKRFDYGETWRATALSEQVLAIRHLRGEIAVTEWDQSWSTTHAPSQRLHWLDYHQRLGDLAQDSPERLAKEVERYLDERRTQRLSSLDTLVVFPFTEPTVLMPTQATFLFATSLLSLENQRRFARTAVGLLRFREQFGNYPKELRELSRVGVAITETQTISEPYYEVSNEGVTLVFTRYAEGVKTTIRFPANENREYRVISLDAIQSAIRFVTKSRCRRPRTTRMSAHHLRVHWLQAL